MATAASFGPERLARISAIERTHFWFVARRMLVERLLVIAAPSPSRILDVGCGTGAFARSLTAGGHHVVAVDLRPEGLRALRDVDSAAAVAQADACGLPVRDAAFDVVIALDVLEHTDDAAALAEIARVTRPGGSVVIAVPALPLLWSTRDEDAGHQRRYTRRSLVALIRRAGLDPVDLRFYQCLLLPAVLAMRVAGRRSRRMQRVEEKPLGWINGAALAINRWEIAASERIRWPWGSSLAALIRKPADSHG